MMLTLGSFHGRRCGGFCSLPFLERTLLWAPHAHLGSLGSRSGRTCDAISNNTAVLTAGTACCAGLVNQAGAADLNHRAARQCVLREVQPQYCARDCRGVRGPQRPPVRPAQSLLPRPRLQWWGTLPSLTLFTQTVYPIDCPVFPLPAVTKLKDLYWRVRSKVR